MKNEMTVSRIAGCFLVVTAWTALVATAFESELWDDNDADMLVENKFHSPLPISYLDPKFLPDNFSWDSIDGVSFLTKSLNQHIPQYCKYYSVGLHFKGS
jgi:hypothetical protein